MIERLQTVWRTVLPFTWNSARPEGKILRSFERAVISSIEYGVTSKCTSVLDSHYFSTRRTYICVCVWNTRYETAIDLYTQYMYSYIYIYIYIYIYLISLIKFISVLLLNGGTRCRSWLRHCATSRKVAGSIPDDVTGIFHWHNPSIRIMVLELTQPLTEKSKEYQEYFLGLKAASA